MSIDVNIVKNIFDKIVDISNIIYPILTLILMWLVSSFYAGKKERQNQQIESINYLVLSVIRYIKYTSNLIKVVKTKQHHFEEYFKTQNDNHKKALAFQKIVAPVPNFDISIEKYSFIVNKNPNIMNLLLEYIQNYNEIKIKIDAVNNDILTHKDDEPLLKNLSKQLAGVYKLDNIAKSNLTRLKFSIYYTFYKLNMLLNEIYEYQNLDWNEDFVCIEIEDTYKPLMQEADEFITGIEKSDKWKTKDIIPIKGIRRNGGNMLRDKQHYLELMFGDIQDESTNKKRREKALNRAWEIRNFEIDLYWKRATYFVAFNAAIFAVILTVNDFIGIPKSMIQICFVILGIIFSLAWVLINISSKHWQENWENHINILENEFEGKLYKTILSKIEKYPLASVSKLNLDLSVLIYCVWCAFLCCLAYLKFCICGLICALGVILILSILIIYISVLHEKKYSWKEKFQILWNLINLVLHRTNIDELYYRQHKSKYN